MEHGRAWNRAAAPASRLLSRFPSRALAANQLEQHVWLHQLVGEWHVSSETMTAPGAEPVKWESRESVRSLGGLWVVAEGTAEYGGRTTRYRDRIELVDADERRMVRHAGFRRQIW